MEEAGSQNDPLLYPISRGQHATINAYSCDTAINTSLISHNTGDICSLNLYYVRMLKYKIKHKIVNCGNTDSVVNCELWQVNCELWKVNCENTDRPLLPWSMTYFIDGPVVVVRFLFQRHLGCRVK